VTAHGNGETSPKVAVTPAPGPPNGLSSAEAKARLRRDGPNRIELSTGRTRLSILASQFASPLVVILVVASVVSVAAGQATEAVIIMSMVGLSATLGFVQEARSQAALEALQRRVALHTTVIRDGGQESLPVGELVVGDIVVLGAGSILPGDGQLLESNHLHLDESPLTGESSPVEKRMPKVSDPGAATPDGGRVFAGTSVVSGTGIALVTATGTRTAYGTIARRLGQRAPESDFQRGIRRFGLLITRVILLLVVGVLVVNVALGRPLIESLLFSIALAVGLTPELLPAIVTLNLTRGARALERNGVLVKRLPAIQNLGSMTVLCTDKTGTLTEGRLAVEGAIDAQGNSNPHVLAMARLNSRFETGFANPLDTAILAAGEGPGALPDVVKLAELPFDFERRCLSVVVAQPGSIALLVAKGAPEAILARSKSIRDGRFVRALDVQDPGSIRALIGRAAERGQRTVAVATRELSVEEAGSLEDAAREPASRRLAELEEGLVFEGLIALSDPPKAGVAGNIADLRAHGVDLKIVTGDDDRVARHVAEQVGVPVRGVLLGDEVGRLSRPALAARVAETTIFARVDPDQKLRIIEALRAEGEVVGYLGDGINDAPALHVADIGISVENATDVARAAADILLLAPNLAAIDQGVVEGRRTFANTLKYIRMGTSSNFGNMLSMAGAALVLPFLPMLPGQILLNNLLYDASQTTIPTDTVDDEIANEPARWDLHQIERFMLVFGPISSLFDYATYGLLLVALGVDEKAFHTGWFIESLATQVLVVFAIRTRRRPFWGSRPSRPLAATVLLTLAVAAVIPFTPLAGPLGFEPLPLLFWPLLAVMVAAYLAFVEVVKGRYIGSRQPLSRATQKA
jgi:P-type Mg2+ transporter